MEAKDEDQLTSLHEACQLKQPHVAKYLVSTNVLDFSF